MLQKGLSSSTYRVYCSHHHAPCIKNAVRQILPFSTGGGGKRLGIYAGLGEVVFPGSKDFSWLRLRRPFPPSPSPLFRSLPSAQCEGINTKPPPLPSLFGGGGNPGEERSRSCWWKEGGKEGDLRERERGQQQLLSPQSEEKKTFLPASFFFPGGGGEEDFTIKTKLSFGFSIF